MTLPDNYSLRKARSEDAEILAIHRGKMFVDMGTFSIEQAKSQYKLWEEWLVGALAEDRFVGVVIEQTGRIVASAGMMFLPKMPNLDDLSLERAYLLNVYVEPEHRRQGLAEVLVLSLIEEAKARQIGTVTLNTSTMGQKLYERLGFKLWQDPDMRLSLK